MTSRILPIVILIVALGLFFGYVHPTYTGSIATLRSEIAGFDAALAAAQEYGKKEAELVAQRNALPPEDLARLEAFLPNGVDNVQLILDLNSLAARSGIELSDFDIAEPQDKSDSESDRFGTPTSDTLVDSLDLSVSAVGSYESFKTFLQGAEQSLRPLDLVELKIDDSTTGVYSYDITFRIYWLKTI